MEIGVLSFIVIVAPFLTTGQAHNNAICSERREDGSYGFDFFNPEFQICCGQRVHQRLKDTECCNATDLYFSDTEICCNGQVSKKFVSKRTKKWEPHCEKDYMDNNCTETMCCGKTLYPKADNTFCCNGKMINLTEEQVRNKILLRCCGSEAKNKKVYNMMKELCCDDAVIPSPDGSIGCCNGNIYLVEKSQCFGDKILKRTESFCGDTKYNRLTSSCCDGRLENRPELIKDENGYPKRNPHVRCCGSFLINSKEKCCLERDYGYQTHSIPNKLDIGCCGTGYYNSTAQLCLAGNPVDKSPYEVPCGDTKIDTREMSCCANKLSYNSSTQECCQGVHYCVVEKGEKCCNGLRMRSNEFCCENVKPCQKEEYGHDDCCYDHFRDNGRTYKKGNFICQDGRVIKVPKGHLLCGHDHFDPSKEFCCKERADKPFKIYSHGTGLCCNGIYNDILPTEGRCCKSKAYKFGDEANPCMRQCDSRQKYDMYTQICCGGRVYNNSDNSKYCCGTRAIDSWSSLACCGGLFPYRTGGSKDCCKGVQVYNKAYSVCTDKGKVKQIGELKGLTDAQKLCKPASLKSFDGGVEHACAGKKIISARMVRSTFNFNPVNGKTEIILYLRSVRSAKVTSTDKPLPKRIKFHIHVDIESCHVDHLNSLSKVIVIFNEDVKHNVVEISNDSPFFITQKTYQRYYSVTKAVYDGLCKTFS